MVISRDTNARPGLRRFVSKGERYQNRGTCQALERQSDWAPGAARDGGQIGSPLVRIACRFVALIVAGLRCFTLDQRGRLDKFPLSRRLRNDIGVTQDHIESVADRMDKMRRRNGAWF